jgi:dimethylamine monooxygenase subunit A
VGSGMEPMSADSFWADPPWRDGRGGYRMGLRPIDGSEWLAEGIAPAERERKGALIARNDPVVFAALAGSEPAQRLALAAVSARHPIEVEGPELPPLARAAMQVADDLCLMQRTDGLYRLVAACVCSPSYWALADKLGGTLAHIHGPVPGLDAKLGARMAAFFERLPSGSVFERCNWFLHLDADPFHPAPEQWAAAGAIDAGRLVMRSERQTLARLADDLVLFTIRVRCRPFARIADVPEAARDLLAALASLSDDERAATGYRYYGAPVVAFLSEIAGKA